MAKTKRTTVRLSDVARERLERITSDYASQSAAIEDALASLENTKIAFGQRIERATADLIDAIKSGDEKAIGGRQMALAELLHSLSAAIGITNAIRGDYETTNTPLS